MSTRHIVAMGGASLFAGIPTALDRYVVDLARSTRSIDRPRACFIGTASGDDPTYALSFHRAYRSLGCEVTDLGLFNRTVADLDALLQATDLVYVGGGNTVSLLAVWRAHGLDRALRAAYERSTVLCGSSAGMNCWFEASVTDSFDLQRLAGVHDGLGLLEGSACPHFDGEAQRRPVYHRLVADGFPGGLAADNAVGLCFGDEQLLEAVSIAPGSAAYRVERRASGVVEQTIEARYLDSGGRDVPV